MIKEIWLAGGCYWGAEKFISQLKGVVSTEVGFANGRVEHPSYDTVKHTETGHAETVQVHYDDEVLTLETLLELFYNIIDPLSVNRQGEDVGTQYRTGVYADNDSDLTIARTSLDQLSRKLGQSVAVECERLQCFYTAEEYHQKYLDKNPGGYCHVSWDMIDKAQSWQPGQSTQLK